MALPKGPNSGGLPPRPGGGGLPLPGAGGLPNPAQRPNPSEGFLPPSGVRPPEQAPQPDLTLSSRDRLGEYDFGSQAVDSTPLNQNMRPQEPEYEYPTFEDESDAFEHERIQEATDRRARETAQRFDKAMEEREPQRKAKNNVLKPQAGELDEKGQNVFIDKKNKKVEPFGGKKSSIKVNHLDRRKNMRQNALIVQVVVIALLLVTLGFAAKNAFMPPAGLDEAAVQDIVYTTTGTTAFPVEQGGYFAQSYMEAYLEYNPSDPVSSSIMQYYAQGSLSPGGVVPGIVTGKNFKQTVVNGPIVYRSQPASANSAIYTVGALVQVENSVPGVVETVAPTTTDGESTGSGDSDAGATIETAPTGSGTASTTSANGNYIWKYFSINVYYDEEEAAFAIASAPTVVPNPDILKTSEIPSAAPIGTGSAVKEETLTAITPTVYGFLSAYRESSPKNFNQLLPFLGAEPDNNLLTGLDGVYEFKGGKADSKSVVINAYATATTTVKAVVTVTWIQNVAGTFVETQSSYVMDIQPISGGYDVTRFLPLAYVPS